MYGKAFSPSGISSFFEACTQKKNGAPIVDPLKIGARGGGFALSKGVITTVNAVPSSSTEITVAINGIIDEARTSKALVTMLLSKQSQSYHLMINHSIDVPIGAGFGTSAAGAFSCGLALTAALELPLTYNQIAQAAHMADITCNTGLGTVAGLAIGGLILVVRGGAPGYGVVDRIPIVPDLKIVAGAFEPIEKSSVLLSEQKIQLINKIARKTMRQILSNPSPANFMATCKNFALQSGLASSRVKDLIIRAEKAGAIGATQNMIGEAVHALTSSKHLDSVKKAFSKDFSEEDILVSPIDFMGARLLS
jgi:pantoate kinase